MDGPLVKGLLKIIIYQGICTFSKIFNHSIPGIVLSEIVLSGYVLILMFELLYRPDKS